MINATELFFTIQPEDLVSWRPDRKGSKVRGIEFAKDHGFKISGDVTQFADGWIETLLRIDFPEGYSFNGRNFTEYSFSVKDQATAWSSLHTFMRELIEKGKD